MANQVSLTVPESLSGSRVDKVVSVLLEISRARASALLAEGVTVDGEPAEARDRVEKGQVLLVPQLTQVTDVEPEPVDFGVLHEDEQVIVVDKPAGLVVHPGAGRRRGTLVAGLLHRWPEIHGVGAEDRWGLVHRLDRDTSGALLVAKNQDAFEDLTSQLRRRDIRRTYTALVEGGMPAATGTIEAPIARDPAQPTKRAVIHGGRPARTHYTVVDPLAGSGLTLVEVRLETGRTHQIRVHMAAIGHPVAADWVYGATRRDLGLDRMFLHSKNLEFRHPVTESTMSVDAPLPEDLAEPLGAVGGVNPAR